MSSIPGLMTPVAISGSALLQAIMEIETSGGINNWPNVEPSYMPEGARFTIEGRVIVGTGHAMTDVAIRRWRKWGLASSASWGPWQILYQTAADLGYAGAPWDLWTEDESRPWVIARLNMIVRRGAVTVAAIADSWNSGWHKDRIVPVEYIRKVEAAYHRFAQQEETT